MDIKKYLPQNQQKLITDDIIAFLESPPDSEFRKSFKENFVRFSDLMTGYNSPGVKKYAEAVMFVSYRLLGFNITDSYRKTFPEKWLRLEEEGVSVSMLQRYASSYSRGKTVISLIERSMVPIHILNMDVHQDAINTQAYLMQHAKSENVRMKAAECLIVNLKPPEEQKIKVDINHHSTALDELKEATRNLALQQKKAIEEGRVNVQEIAEKPILLGSGGHDIIDMDT